MELEQLLTLIQTVSDSKLTEFKYETETLCVKMGKESSVKVVTADPQMMAAVPAASAAVEAPDTEEEKAPEGKIVASPLVGTFYAAPSEDAAPYVQVGDAVKKGSILVISNFWQTITNSIIVVYFILSGKQDGKLAL